MKRNDVQGLRKAIMAEAKAETSQILQDAEAKARSVREQARSQAEAKREQILERAHQEVGDGCSHTIAMAQLEAQTLKLKRREQLLERTFAQARQRLAALPQSPDYAQVARCLVKEAAACLLPPPGGRLGGGPDQELVLLADQETRTVLSDEVLADLENELGLRLLVGEPLTRGVGVVLRTVDGHRQFDNTLGTRLSRMRDALRAPIYHILMGGEP
jgi:vacuolar-type H+-ATPase subunit E/Vma4